MMGTFAACIDHKVSTGVNPDNKAYNDAPYPTKKLRTRRKLE